MANTSLTIPYKFAGETKAVANEVNANFEAIEIFSNGVNAELEDLNKALTELQRKPTREMFDIYYNFSGIAPIGAYPLWTGETITNCRTIYPDFWKEAVRLKNNNAIRNGTNEEYEYELDNYGETGMFVIDELNGHIRLPKILHFISSITDLSENGCSYNDTQQRVYGNFWTMNWQENYANSADGNFKIADQYSASIRTGDGGRWLGKKVRLDSGTTCRNGNYVQPRHVKLCLYIQVANNVADISMMDINVIANQLSDAIAQLQALSQQYVSDLEAKEVEINSNIVATTGTFNETATEKIEELSSLVSSISDSQRIVEEAEESVLTKVEEVKNSCILAQSSAEQAVESREVVVDCKNDILSLKQDVVEYAKKAEDSANDLSIQNIKNKMTNCITEIPQDIKLELADGLVILKAGSRVYIPNGFEADGVTPKFDIVVTTSDVAYSWDSTDTNNLSLYYRQDGGGLIAYATDTDISGGETPSIGNFYNVNTNTIYRINKGQVLSYQLSLPLAHITSGSNMITSIDQIFNGFGYIGSTVFALPNVKGLIPNGRNADGSLNNVEVTSTSVTTWTVVGNTNYQQSGIWVSPIDKTWYLANVYYETDGEPAVNGNHALWFNHRNNAVKITTNGGSTWTTKQFVRIGLISTTGTTINSAFFNKSFQAVDRNDSSWIAEQAMPSNKYINLTLGASNSQYTAPANGYFQISKTAGVSGAQVNFSTPDNGFGALFYSGASTGSYCKGFLPVKKGQTINIQYSATGATNLFRFIYAEGEI